MPASADAIPVPSPSGRGSARIFLAGASGVIGIRLLPLLVSAGHPVAAMTRSPAKAEELRALGGQPVVCDVYELEELRRKVAGFAPEIVIHQLTDLPDRAEDLSRFADANRRIRTEGTRNLIAAARGAGAGRFLAQSIAWRQPGRADSIEEHERRVLEISGVVVRYGQLYGPGTYYPDTLPEQPRVHVERAAAATAELLDADSGVVVVADPTVPPG
jgi:hypothetical protein